MVVAHSCTPPPPPREQVGWAAALALALLWLFISFPVFGRQVGWHDYFFHLQRITSLAQALAYEYPVYLYPGFSREYGYPLGIFYGDTFLYPFAWLVRLEWATPLDALRLYVLYRNAALLAVSFFSFRRIYNATGVALFGCALYAASIWPLNNVYVRCAVGEYTAMVFLPLLAAGMADIRRGRGKSGALLLAAGYAGLLRAQMIASLLSSIILALYVLLEWRVFWRWNMLKPLLGAAGLALLLNASFLVPCTAYYVSALVNVAQPGTPEGMIESAMRLHGTGLSLWQMLALDYVVMSGGGNRLADGRVMPYQAMGVGAALMAAFAVGLVLLWWARGNGRRAALLRPLGVTLLLGEYALWLSSAYFPWHFVAEYAPVLYQIMGGKIQFGMRYTTMALVLLTLAAMHTVRMLGRRHAASFVAAVLLLLFSQSAQFMARIDRETIVRSHGTWNIFTIKDDWLYRLKGARLPKNGEERLLFSHKERAGEAWISDVLRADFFFSLRAKNATDEPAWLDFPVWNYPGYRAVDSAGQSLKIKDGRNRRVRVVLPPGFESALTLRFTPPWHWRAAFWVSQISAVVLMLWLSGVSTRLAYARVRVRAFAPGATLPW